MSVRPEAIAPRVSVIAAVAENGVIGVRNALPWRLPADLRRFRALTGGRYVLMGRRTCESLGRPLADRVNLVLSSQPAYAPAGFTIVRSIEAALALAPAGAELFVIGGASVYAQTLARAERLYLTLVHAAVEGDCWFPVYDCRDWKETERQPHGADDRHRYAFTFVTMERIFQSPAEGGL